MKDLDVSIDADTDTHSEAPRDTETDKDGEFSWSGVQDGVYSIAVASSDDYTVTPKSDRVNVYHDEFEDDDDEDTDYVGTADTDHADFSATFTYYNFALLHGDGEFSGRVFEARGEPGGIAVELRRCETYTPDDATTDEDEERCREDTDFGAQTENAGSSGRWDFPSLREGYYVANIAATTYNRAKWGDDGIDDDAANCEGGDDAVEDCDDDRTDDMSGMLEGKRAFNRSGATFRVFNRTLGSDAQVTNLVIEGTTDVDDGDEELADISITSHDDGDQVNTVTGPSAEVTWASKDITVTPTLMDERASVRVIVGDVDDPDDVGSGGDDDDISVDLESGVNTVTVIGTAENGYNDFTYSFNVTRTTPVDAVVDRPRSSDLRRAGANSLRPRKRPDSNPAFVEQTIFRARNGRTNADNMSLHIRVTGSCHVGLSAIVSSRYWVRQDRLRPPSDRR